MGKGVVEEKGNMEEGVKGGPVRERRAAGRQRV
jgi:hypothetical protein